VRVVFRLGQIFRPVGRVELFPTFGQKEAEADEEGEQGVERDEE